MASRTFTVVTKHPTVERLNGSFTFTIGETDYGQGTVYYASADKFGCSKDYGSPQAAILGMCGDHGCSVVWIGADDGATASTVHRTAPLAVPGAKHTANDWRDAVAMGTTVLGLDDWLTMKRAGRGARR